MAVARSWRSWVWRLAVAVLCAVVLVGHVPGEFERVRLRLVTAPRAPEGGRVHVDLPDLARAGRPAALVIRLRGGTAATSQRVRTESGEIARLATPAARQVRTDLTLAAPAAAGRRLEVSGSGDWTLEYLEVANVFGFTRGPLTVQITPAAAPRPRPWLPVPAALLLSLVVAACAGSRAEGRAVRAVTHGGRAVGAALLLSVALADVFTPYRLLLAAHSFLLVAALLCVPLAWRACRAVAAEAPRARGLLRGAPAYIAPAAGLLAVAVAVIAFVLGSHAAGGADSSGYISQAALWARGALVSPELLVRDLPPGLDPAVASPLGWVPHLAAGAPDRLVPTYSPGLPLLMAALEKLAGPPAVYLVVPALAGLAIWATFLLGRRIGGPAVGGFAALWLAFSPAFLLSMLNPMSDVPVTAWWTLASALALGRGRTAPLAAGFAASLGVLTRPNLAPLAAVVGVLVLLAAPAATRERLRRTALLAAGLVPGVTVVALLFDFWYGSPLRSGYGSLEYLYSTANILPNVARYPTWFLETQTVVPLAALGAPFVLRHEVPAGVTAAPHRAAVAWTLIGFAAAVCGQYLLYTPFESWDYLRFLLPAYPACLVLAGVTLAAVFRRTAVPRLLAIAVLTLLCVHGYRYMDRKTEFRIAAAEARYRRVGEYVREHLPAGAVLLSMQHSGSVRFYAGTPILRYDVLPPERLDETIARMERTGRRVYLVLDAWEAPLFRARFRDVSSLGALDWTPIAVARGNDTVLVYEAGTQHGPGPRAPHEIP